MAGDEKSTSNADNRPRDNLYEDPDGRLCRGGIGNSRSIEPSRPAATGDASLDSSFRDCVLSFISMSIVPLGRRWKISSGDLDHCEEI